MADMTTTIPPASIVLGTMDYGTAVDPQLSFAILDRFVERGGTWLDTANCYAYWKDPSGMGGASERVLGDWFRSRSGVRDRVLIATKVRHNPVSPGGPSEGLSAAAISSGFAASLDRLGLDRVDLLWAHAEDRTVPLRETVEAFGTLVREGTVARLGAANHAGWRVAQARDIAVAAGLEPWTALQLRHSLVQPRPGTPIPEGGHKLLQPDDLDLARSEDLAVWAYSPLMWGGYTRADRPLPETYDHPGTTRLLAEIAAVADELGATRNQVVLAWLLRQGISPIVGASRLAYIDEAMGTLDIALADEQLARLDAAR